MFIYRELTPKIFLDTLKETAKDIGIIMFLVCLSGIVGYGIVYDRGPQRLSVFLMSVSSNQYVMLWVVIGILVIAGMFIETTVIALLMTPILLPGAVFAGSHLCSRA